MKKILLRLSKTIFMALIISFIGIAQESIHNRFEQMRYAFMLGLKEKGLETALDILSDKNVNEVKEETLFYVAEYFLTNGIKHDNVDEIERAYNFYSRFIATYPDSKYRDIVDRRVSLIESSYYLELLLIDYFSEYSTELNIVRRIFENTDIFLGIYPPNPYVFFTEGRFNQPPVFIANKYFDEIIVNYPQFAVYGYYYKILSYLDQFPEISTLREALVPLERKTISKSNVAEYAAAKNRLYEYLDTLSVRFPDHPVTMDLHLLFGRIFMESRRGGINVLTLRHLEYILRNDEDPLSVRFILAREFIENNSFLSEWESINEGMTKRQVEMILGEPNRVDSHNWYYDKYNGRIFFSTFGVVSNIYRN
jgi:hypothetical protein